MNNFLLLQKFLIFLLSYVSEVIPPVRWLVATLVPLIIAAWGLKRKSLNKSGAFLGKKIQYPFDFFITIHLLFKFFSIFP